MASQKNELKRHIEYLYARRSGAEYCLDKSSDEIKGFIHTLSTSLQDTQSKLATIEKEEQRLKDEKKAADKYAADKRMRGVS